MKNFHRKASLVLFLLVLCTPLFAQSNCTNTPSTGAPLSLALPVQHCQQWSVQLNQNFSAINTFANGVVLLNPMASQAVANVPGTYTQFNALQIFGTVPSIAFGVVAGTPNGFVTETGAGLFSLDAVTPGDFQGAMTMKTMNVQTGYVYQGGIGVSPGQCLVAGSDSAHTFVPAVCFSPAGVFYQTVVAGSSPMAQRGNLQFGTAFTATDNAGANQTQIGLAATGATAGTYTNPTIAVNAQGQVTSISNGVSGADIYFSFTACSIAQTGNLYSCGGTYTGSPFPVANANYTPVCQPMITQIGGSFVLNESALSASSMTYTWTQTMGNGTSGAARAPLVFCHIHMN